MLVAKILWETATTYLDTEMFVNQVLAYLGGISEASFYCIWETGSVIQDT